MPMYVEYPNEKGIFHLVAPQGVGALAEAFCRHTKADAPILPPEKLATLTADVYHINPKAQPRVYLADDVEKLRSLTFPEGSAAGYISRHGQYISATDPRLAALLNRKAEPVLYKLGWIKIYPGAQGKPENGQWSNRGLHLIQGLPCRLQADMIRQLGCTENPDSPGFLQLAPDQVEDMLRTIMKSGKNQTAPPRPDAGCHATPV